ncbi:hypothetical protein DSM106972_007990 [Dulcicalothrix desertica PCC 7102]|uniref:DSP-PTPase phosphatase fused to NAD+ Kinase domain-containing protein n=1 Tax=Dulcicalothrix desertica PCC 7102 TaxID=232991 RepID=A0A433VW30_9CYAN|nr:protein tyrosine phosphatase family protein [Dulcicalothrix desertica]RUT10304.1 hypothetical protein DSM106972_007990 [Dulcicalothrix desertica PCC 7102]TWH40723.1 protein tyrosine phosphatase (PTP) superfamily phosphohydrolase (DUF442 family) [Dulcicalothrix desertica PCC 7102]
MSKQNFEEIYNYLQISDGIATSGQPTVEQFDAIKQAGYEVVVNLALVDSLNALPNQKEIIEAQEMQYIHIPVIWDNPTLENLHSFFEVMKANQNKKVFVHCAANKRVSVFVYLYRRICLGASEEEAKLDLNKLWAPNEVWQRLINEAFDNVGLR